MKRRQFIIAAATTPLFAPFVLAGTNTVTFAPGIVQEMLAAGQTVHVDFFASWCPTCRAQERVLEGLRTKFPVYNDNIEFVILNWDLYSRAEISLKHNIPRRSTLLLLRGDQELGRNVAGTSYGSIKRLLDLALDEPASA